MLVLLTTLALAAQATTTAPPAAPAAPAPVAYPAIGTPIRLAQARTVLDAALEDARQRGIAVAIAIVEPDGTLVAYARSDGAPYSAIDVSQAKAKSAALFRRPTLAWSQAVASGRVQVLSLPNVVAIEGGVPLLIDGKLAGAIGVSGGTSEQDGMIAAAGAAAMR